MRIWHQQLIPSLCKNHLLAVWREALGAYSIIVDGKKGYRNHPATIEFLSCPEALHERLCLIRVEMVKRGWKPKELPLKVSFGGSVAEWQSLEQQTEHLKSKNCLCHLT